MRTKNELYQEALRTVARRCRCKAEADRPAGTKRTAR